MANQTLNPVTFPLHGQRLIEASAGTGKTYTITGLYLRLLLGHGDEQTAFSSPLSVDNILVVTFTEAATQELRARIRERIFQARLAFSRSESRDPLIASLLIEVPDHPHAERVLLQAQRQMDEAAIYTIHGFCQRMLTQNAFESGSLFSHEFITDESILRERAVADFWRREFYPLEKSVAAIVRSDWCSPDKLLNDIAPYLSGPLVNIIAPAMPEQLGDLHRENCQKIDVVKLLWRAISADVEALINGSGVDKRSYSKRSLPLWIASITDWANKPTVNYDVPDNLARFAANTLHEKTKKGEIPTNAAFDAIDALTVFPPSLKNALTAHAIREVRLLLANEKRRFGWLSFDDLLSQLYLALKNDSDGILAARIRALYPVAMIDEFQDTDPQQYHIFSDIYQHQPQCGLFMIGDPKQAIYAFRGADIFTYIDARRQVLDHYNLTINWRSTADMIAAVNGLFCFANAPFIYDQDIPFIPVGHAPNADKRHWHWRGAIQPALCFWLEENPALQSKGDYEDKMANAAAVNIRELLNDAQQQRAYFDNENEKIPITAGDIAVLVRSASEAAKIKLALSDQGIASVYLSNRNSVFSSVLAGDVLRLLAAVLSPESERTLRAALASGLFGLSADDIDALNVDEKKWERAVIEFSGYQTVWFSRGVLPMLRQLVQRRGISQRLLGEKNGERALTDLLHLGELLQEASQQLDSHFALIRWLATHMDKPNGNVEEQQVRLESERNLVKIVTIHKSKGLEYPLVYLPFACNYRRSKQPLYHDENHAPVLALTDPEAAIELADNERLAEDLRLIYVALTRAIYGCFIGMAPLKEGRKSTGNTGLHHSAIGYLIQGGKECDGNGLRHALESLVENHPYIAVSAPPAFSQEKLITVPFDVEQLTVRSFQGHIQRNWRLTSYSGLVKQGHSSSLPALPAFDLDAASDDQTREPSTEQGPEPLIAEPFSSIFQFPRGARPGTFIHTLFENVHFDQEMLSDEVAGIIRHLLGVENYDEAWLPVLQRLLGTVLSVPLNQQGMQLSAVSDDERLTEMEFIMPIEQLSCGRVNRLIQQFDPLSATAGMLNFDTATGMLKGFIDLVFCWQGQYFILDWKSNYLGDDCCAYNTAAIEKAMVEHRYDFQYQIYCLALHRFLRQRIADYSYSTHFGGVYYLFVRGMEQDTAHGIFYTKPEQALIDGLDSLFGDAEDNGDV